MRVVSRVQIAPPVQTRWGEVLLAAQPPLERQDSVRAAAPQPLRIDAVCDAMRDAPKMLERPVAMGVLISVDVETSGADPWAGSLATIGAAAIDDSTLSIIGTFYARLSEPEDGWQWQPEQQTWWREQDPRVFAEAFDAGPDRRPAGEVAAAFAEWALSLAPRPRFTARPVTFDWTWVAKMFGEAGVVNPFGFRGHDIGELIRGLVGAEFKAPYFDPLAIMFGIEIVQSVESEHNALADAVAQAELVIAVFNAMRQRSV